MEKIILRAGIVALALALSACAKDGVAAILRWNDASTPD